MRYFYYFTIYLLVGFIPNTIKANESFPKALRQNTILFEENKGQVATFKNLPNYEVLFRTHTNAIDFYVTQKGLTWVFKERIEDKTANETEASDQEKEYDEEKSVSYYWNRINMELLDAQINQKNIITYNRSQYYSNFYLSHCPEGILDVRYYEKIMIKDVYPGIDWVIYGGGEGKIKHEFVVAPGYDPQIIKWRYSGIDNETLQSMGSLKLTCSLGKIEEASPYIYQQINNKHLPIDGSYKQVNAYWQYNISEYCKSSILTIDPDLVWGTYFGKDRNDGFRDITYVPRDSSIYVFGYSSNFPIDSTEGSVFQGTLGGGLNDAIVFRIKDEGDLMWSTYYGGNGVEFPWACAIDKDENIYAVGETESTNFPTAAHAGAWYQTTHEGGFRDGFIFKLNSIGQRIWGSYLGTSGEDDIMSIKIDYENKLIISGSTSFSELLDDIASPDAFQTELTGLSNGIYVAKLELDGSPIWGTFFGGSWGESVRGMAIDKKNNIFITGYTNSKDDFPLIAENNLSWVKPYSRPPIGTNYEGYIAKFSPKGQPVWSTYFGSIEHDYGRDVAIGNCGEVYLLGNTPGPANDFPLKQLEGAYFQDEVRGYSDLYLAKFSNSGELLWSTFLGGSADEGFSIKWKIDTDNSGGLYITGGIAGGDFPLMFKPTDWKQTTRAGITDIVCVHFDHMGKLKWSTYLGSNGNYGDFGTGLTLSPKGDVFFIGEIKGTGFNALKNPGGAAYYQSVYGGEDDSYLIKFSPVCPRVSFSNSCVCYNDSIELNIDNATSIQWSFNNDNDAIIYYPSTDTSIVAYVSNALCTDTIVIPIIVYLDKGEIWGDTLVCANDSATLFASAEDVDVFLWDNGDSLNFTTYAPPYTQNQYGITLYHINPACTLNLSTTITIQDSFGTVSNDTIICMGDTIKIKAGGGHSYLWSSGQSTASISVLPKSDTIISVLVIDTITNCSAEHNINISLIEGGECIERIIYIPNVFALNGNNNNFKPLITGIYKNYELSIYDRYGKLVFITNDPAQSWNGTNNTANSQAVYVYKLILDNEEQYTGNVLLLK